MSKIFVPENHVCVTASNDVAALCQPLFKTHGLSFFDYGRVYRDGSVTVLSSNGQATKSIAQDFIVVPNLTNNSDNINYQVVSSSLELVNSQLNPFLKYTRDAFNLDHILMVTEKNNSYMDIFTFATDSNNVGAINFYLNKKDLIKNFTLYFKDEAADLIDLAEKQKISPTKELRSTYANIVKNCGKDDNKADPFLSKIQQQVKRKLVINGQTIIFSPREVDCLRLTQQGRTAKEAARALELSQRTVETHLVTAKDKLGCHTKSELLNILSKHNFP